MTDWFSILVETFQTSEKQPTQQHPAYYKKIALANVDIFVCNCSGGAFDQMYQPRLCVCYNPQ